MILIRLDVPNSGVTLEPTRLDFSEPVTHCSAVYSALSFPFPFPTTALNGLPFPTAPDARHALKMASLISFTPSPCRTAAKIVGPPSRMIAASRLMTSSDAPTWGAKSVYRREAGLVGC